MAGVLRGVRSAVSLLAVMLLFVPGGVVLRLVVLPTIWLFPAKRTHLVSEFMKAMSRGIRGGMRLGGARFRSTGTLPTRDPILVVANHQSLLDIVLITLMGDPFVPAFVTRRRYAHFVPLVAPCVRNLPCPIIDPKRDVRGAVAAIEAAARTPHHGILLFPEGHRTLDGEVRPFRAAGLLAALRAKRVPVYLVVTDGLWTCRRLVDFVFNIYKMDGESEVLGPFEPPAAEEQIEGFVSGLRETIVAHLHEMRRRRGNA